MPKNEPTPNAVVETRVREIAKKIGGDDIRLDGEFVDELNKRVTAEIEDAVRRAKANDRKTLRPNDL